MCLFGCYCCFRWTGVALFTKTRVITHNCFAVLMDLFRCLSTAILTLPYLSHYSNFARHLFNSNLDLIAEIVGMFGKLY